MAVLTVQPEAAPSPLGCEAKVDEATEKPDGVVQPPVSDVQNCTPTDLTAVAVGRALLVSVYETPVAPPTELDNVILRPVIAPALANGAWMKGVTTSKNAKSTLWSRSLRRVFIFVIVYIIQWLVTDVTIIA